MKEATGELNLTLVVVTIVALLSTLFFTVIWPRINRNLDRNANCDSAICNCEKNNVNDTECSNVSNGMAKCKYYDKDGEHDIYCAWKG